MWKIHVQMKLLKKGWYTLELWIMEQNTHNNAQGGVLTVNFHTENNIVQKLGRQSTEHPLYSAVPKA